MAPESKPAIPGVAVIGCGQWGKNHIRNFARLGALRAVWDADTERAAALAKEFGVAAIPLDKIVADASISGVCVASPPITHFDVASACLKAGKHVFVEKPIALDVKDAVALEKLAKDAGRTLMVGHLLHYHPAFLTLLQMVRDGKLGKLQYLYSNRLNLGRIRQEENALWSFAPHDISMILALVGSTPSRVHAVGGRFLHKSIADVTTTELEFPGGEQAHIFVSWLHPFKEQKLVVIGDGGMAVFDDGQPWDSKLLLYPHEIKWVGGAPSPAKAAAVKVDVAEAEPLGLECQHFLDCIANGTPPRTDGAEATRVLRVLTAAQTSMETGKWESMMSAASSPSSPPGVTIHPTAHVDDGVEIGAGTKIWHYTHILPRSRIGRDCIIGQNVMIGPDVAIGNKCKIQNNVSLYTGVTLDDGVFCGPSCVFTNVLTPRAEVERKTEFLPTPVGRGATIGANATVVCGNSLGAYCMIGAGSVVTKDVLPHALIVGVPGKQIGWVSHDGEVLGDDLVCPRSGRRYKVEAGQLAEIVTKK
ncbi:MAG: Gfo/Idh/MocA family oxidoreductase [Rhodobacteraceae bacterium]|nr:Gfo/Idh/MocA family oxidoreductase [Paracoccaceae bacterium]